MTNGEAKFPGQSGLRDEEVALYGIEKLAEGVWTGGRRRRNFVALGSNLFGQDSE